MTARVEVFALIGESGTGKSYKAILVADNKGIDTIIDDGLLIKDGKKLAGSSAKRELTSIQAVKRAIFMDKDHAQEVKDKLSEINPKRILILGTSQKMVEKIAMALDLQKPQHLVFIEDISSELEIIKAKKMRQEFGKHVIPVPTIEIKKDFPNYLIDPLQFFFRKKGKKKVGEKSIVRPRFNMIGKLIISENAIEQLVKASAEQVGVKQVLKTNVEIGEDGVNIATEIKLDYPGKNFKMVARDFQQKTIELVENLTGLDVLWIDVRIKGIQIEKI